MDTETQKMKLVNDFLRHFVDGYMRATHDQAH